MTAINLYLTIPSMETKTKFIIDGDMPAPAVEASVKLSGYWNRPSIFRLESSNQKRPKFISRLLLTSTIDYVPIHSYRAKKETTDKQILCYIQKSICEGVSEFFVFTQDYDFSYDCAHIQKQNLGVKINVIFLMGAGTLPKTEKPSNLTYIKVSSVVEQTNKFKDQLIENQRLTSLLQKSL